jgi:hypothetical protein
LPADFSKLSTFAGSLTSAKVERLVTQNPERISRLEFTDTRVSLADADGKSLVSLTLGKNADGGGRFVKFDDVPKAYLSRVNVWLDATARNWADTALLTFATDDIASVTVGFPAGEPLEFTRPDKSTAFTTASTPQGQQVKASALTTLLGNFSSLRFTETTAPDAPEAAGAREHARTVILKTFSGKTYTVAVGRQPERTIVKPEATKAAPDVLLAETIKPATPEAEKEKAGPAAVVGPLTETVPAGPVFAFITHSDKTAPINTLMTKRGFQIGEFVFTSLPADRSALFEPAPAPAAPAEKSAAK